MLPVLYIGTAQGLFMAFFFVIRDPARPGDRAAALLMALLSLPLVGQLLAMKLAVAGHVIPRLLASPAFPLAYGPLLLLYTGSMTGTGGRFSPARLLHGIPFVLAAAAGLVCGPGPLPQHPPFSPAGGPPRSLYAACDIAAMVSMITYSAVLFHLLRRHRERLWDYYSHLSHRVTLLWLFWIALSFVLAYLFVLLVLLGAVTIPRIHRLEAAALSRWAAITFFIYAFSFFSLNQPAVLREGGDGVREERQPEKRYEKSGLKEEDADGYLAALEDYMNRKKPYLQGDLTIAEVSKQLEIPKHYITQIINERLHKNFYTYVNEYRVGEAIRRMSQGKYREHTILRIAYDSGFNSKSAFNTVFKRHTALSPTEYRKTQASRAGDQG
ncbi:MAG: helix-turn-helix transcriptional regulator [Spirochaetes bacterium]|nr:helix-turn-helix transcriptional regulator [Spirochaetota bacterium]